MRMRVPRGWRVLLVAVVAGALVGCGTQGDDARGEQTVTPTEWPRPTGEELVVDPERSIDDAEALEVDGLSLLVPRGWDVTREEVSGGLRVTLVPPGDTMNIVALSFEGEGADADAVEMSASYAASMLAASGGEDVTQRPVSWSGWLYASATSGVGDGGATDLLAFDMLTRDRRLVGLVVRAPVGTMEESLQYRVARSLKDLG